MPLEVIGEPDIERVPCEVLPFLIATLETVPLPLNAEYTAPLVIAFVLPD